jgi:hypothetical protein
MGGDAEELKVSSNYTISEYASYQRREPLPETATLRKTPSTETCQYGVILKHEIHLSSTTATMFGGMEAIKSY